MAVVIRPIVSAGVALMAAGAPAAASGPGRAFRRRFPPAGMAERQTRRT